MKILFPSQLTLRTRLFLVFGALVVLLVLAQGWLMRALTRDLGEELDQVAFTVGSSVASVLTVEGLSGEGAQHGPLVLTPATGLTADVRVIDGASGPHLQGRHALASKQTQKGSAAPDIETRDVETRDAETEDGAKPAEVTSHAADGASVTWVWTSEAGFLEGPPDDIPEHLARLLEHPHPEGAPGSRNTLHIQGVDRGFGLHVAGDVESRVLMLELPDTTAAVPIPRVGLRDKIERFQRRLWLGSGLLLVVGLVAAGMTAHRIAAPLARLADAAEQVGEGELGLQVEAAGGGPEVGRTITAFNAMSSRLATLREKNRRLEALRQLEEIGDVARGMAHSLRNPLNALGLSVEQLAAGDEAALEPTSRAGRLAEAARRQISRLDAGIRSFLLLASPGDGAQTEDVAMDELVRDVALEALQDAGGRVGLDLDLDGAAEARLSAVPAELRAVVQALVVNALEASPDGQRVTLRLSQPAAEERGEGEGPGQENPADGRLLFEVEDRGPGLPESIRARLFTPHLSSKPTGSGMGLFLAHRLASHRYGGSLELLDREDGGTRARLVVGPRKPVETDGSDEVEP